MVPVLGQPRLVVSSLGPREGALAGVLDTPEIVLATDAPFEVELAGERLIGVRSLSAETAAFRQFRTSLIAVSLGVMLLALVVAWFVASRITGPVRTLVGLVDRARDGSFSGAVSVGSRDEIGVLARRITHRNVLRTHDFGEAEGVPFISMEYLEGVTLKELVRNRGRLPLGVGLSFAKQMCHGLEAAHAQGVVHRDIKPHNVLILPESGELKIMDFGIARPSQVAGQDPSLTTAGTVLGTPDYMSPEQAQGRPADFRADIYSLGVVLFEALTGQLPFRGDTVTEVVIAHIQQPPPRPRGVNPKLPEGLEVAILRCLEKDPARRWQNVGELVEALNAVSTGSEAA